MSEAIPRTGSAAIPGLRRVVALGGGTGMPAVLRGLRAYLQGDDVQALTAVVTMTDDGGSSGRLRRTRGVLPPGDVRNCLVALAQEEDLLARLFQHRYSGSFELGGHSLGNLILTALAEETGSFLRSVEVISRVLRTCGQILPATLDDTVLEAELADGTTLVGESRIGRTTGRIRRVRLNPQNAAPTPGVLEAIRQADLIVLGPGSLYTSLLPNLVVRGVSEALARSSGVCVLVGNLVSEHGEAADLDLDDHLRIIEDHAGATVIDAVLVHDGPIDDRTLERYRDEGATPLTPPKSGSRPVVRRNLLDAGPKLRHHPEATAQGLIDAWIRLRGAEAAAARDWSENARRRDGQT